MSGDVQARGLRLWRGGPPSVEPSRRGPTTTGRSALGEGCAAIDRFMAGERWAAAGHSVEGRGGRHRGRGVPGRWSVVRSGHTRELVSREVGVRQQVVSGKVEARQETGWRRGQDALSGRGRLCLWLGESGRTAADGSSCCGHHIVGGMWIERWGSWPGKKVGRWGSFCTVGGRWCGTVRLGWVA
jgi:hypothetical protein